MRSVELFAGGGGLALGLSEVGFQHEAVVELAPIPCETIRENQNRGVKHVVNWPLHEMDVSEFDYRDIRTGIELVAGGPPCQPFSLGGKHRGRRDTRDMFPEMVRSVRELQPKAILVENVKGLVRRSFAEYFEYILLQFSFPEIVRKKGERWTSHLARLERHQTKGRYKGLSYRMVFRLLNAADYGVPQRRERVFMVGFRSDLKVEWAFPEPSHSQEALLWDQWVTGEYWDRHRVSVRKRPEKPPRLDARIQRLKNEMFKPAEESWVTVREALAGLPDPEKNPRLAARALNHKFNPGARSYPGHTGSPSDEPAKTLKAGVHGVPGGENMLAFGDGTVRYFTAREAARLQTFPDNYYLHGAWTEAMRQVGNAVPVKLAATVGKDIKKELVRNGRGARA